MPDKNSALTFLIIDDEKGACDNLKNILSEYADGGIKILGTANDTTDAEKLIKELNPDAVFLDIAMPGENAFQFLERIFPYNFEIIFVTAYDEFAIKAFKLNAVDYIQKPIRIPELLDAIKKLRERIEYKQYARYKEYEINAVKQIATKELPQKIVLKSLNHTEIVDFKDIYFIEGQGNYCKISFNKSGVEKEIVTSGLINGYEELLPAWTFYRVHKSYLVNCKHINDIKSDDKYSYAVVMKNNCKLLVSRRRLAGFIQFLKENNFYNA